MHLALSLSTFLGRLQRVQNRKRSTLLYWYKKNELIITLNYIDKGTEDVTPEKTSLFKNYLSHSELLIVQSAKAATSGAYYIVMKLLEWKSCQNA